MRGPYCHENYPFGSVFVSNLLFLLMYGVGVYILYQSGIIWVILYVLFILLLEFRLRSFSIPEKTDNPARGESFSGMHPLSISFHPVCLSRRECLVNLFPHAKIARLGIDKGVHLRNIRLSIGHT